MRLLAIVCLLLVSLVTAANWCGAADAPPPNAPPAAEAPAAPVPAPAPAGEDAAPACRYQRRKDGHIVRLSDGATIPPDEGNADYQAFLAEGGAVPADSKPEASPASKAKTKKPKA